MTDKDRLRQMPFRPNRRQILSGMASLGVLAGGESASAFARGPPKRIIVPEGDFAPLPIAIPNFVAGTPSDGDVGAGVTQVITNNLKRSGLFAPIDQAAYIEKIINIDAAPQFQNWKTINAQALVTGRMTRQGDGRLKAEFRLWDVATGQQLGRPAIFHLAGKLAADRAHHFRPDLRAADRREGLFRQPRGVRRRNRLRAAAHQAAGADGSGRRQCPLSDHAAPIWC